MIEIVIPGYGDVKIAHIVMDYNGTMACDGIVLDNLREITDILSKKVDLHVITADTFGIAEEQLKDFPVSLSILPESSQDKAKLMYVEQLGCDNCVAIGNGRNDSAMLEAAKIGIVLLQEEGAAVKSTMAADIMCRDLRSALSLFTEHKRLTATLRS
ncbi:MAG: ATPase P [Thermodesulfobacteriota bacterium]|nr:ATPase P [Thermodesulfobacteriota bacterium]